MLFNSIAFLVFAPLFFLLYFSLYSTRRLAFIVLASYFFYAWWDWRFLGLLGGSTLVTFYSARAVRGTANIALQKIAIGTCIGLHLVALAFFKYTAFLFDSAEHFLASAGIHFTSPEFQITLPVGISFFTFTSLSYIIDVYREKIDPHSSSLLQFATYECLFPHLVAGPILRASNFLPQLATDYRFDWSRAASAVELIAWGYLLKVGLADNAALFADPRFNNPYIFTSSSLLLAVLAFALQIYGDFAGYSLIAIGLARMMGYDFGVNFNRPYFAENFSDFWQRWHISLSSWIRDYLYIPLGGNRGGTARTIVNLLTTMFLAGLWHGAGWNFAIWGLLHGTYLIGQRVLSTGYSRFLSMLRVPERFQRILSVLIVFLLTCIGWVFFRCKHLSDAVYILKACLFWDITTGLSFGGMRFQLLRLSILALVVLLVDLAATSKSLRDLYFKTDVIRTVGLAVICVLILFLGDFSSNTFIYFQF